MNSRCFVLIAALSACAAHAHAQTDATPAPAAAARIEPSKAQTMTWDVNGVKREAIVYVPEGATTTPAPLVFAFHGHGGSSGQFARSSEFQTAWPQAIVVYPQGLPTAGMTDPQGKKAGWQRGPGAEGDRDLKFFDAMLAGLKSQFKLDERRIYSTGHSNGGGFTYLLWGQRGSIFAALGPSAAGAAASRDATFVARPLIHIAGENDTVVPIAFQQRTLTAARAINGCDGEGSTWAKYCTQYLSKSGTPIVVCLQPGGHKYYEQATELIVRFFKEHALPENKPADKPADPAAAPDAPAAPAPAPAPKPDSH